MSLTRFEANGLRPLPGGSGLVEGASSSLLLSDSVLKSVPLGDDLVLAKHILIVLEGGFSFSSLTSFLFVEDLVNGIEIALGSLRLSPLGSVDGRTESTIRRFGEFSRNVLMFCSSNVLRLTLFDSGDGDAKEPGLGVDLSHFSKMIREFFGVVSTLLVVGDSPSGRGVEKPPDRCCCVISGLSKLEADVQDIESRNLKAGN